MTGLSGLLYLVYAVVVEVESAPPLCSSASVSLFSASDSVTGASLIVSSSVYGS